MNIRLLEPSDAALYRRIRQQALAEAPQFVGPLGEREAGSDLADLQARLAAYPSEGVRVFGLFMADTCAAVAGLSRQPNPKYAHKLFLWGLYVLPDHRGRSVGRGLLQWLLDYARELPGVRFVALQVTKTNEPARALYLAHGFRRYGEEPAALLVDGRSFDFELMQLDLDHYIPGRKLGSGL